MSTYPLTIVGAGLAGLLAAHAWPTARIIEAAPGPNPSHRALLRFRSDAVSRLTGIPFRKVLVRKGIFYNDSFRRPSIALANLYAWKCLGKYIGDRSIWNLDPVDRYIAPEEFYGALLYSVGSRIEWGTSCFYEKQKGPYISTAPLPSVAPLLKDWDTVGNWQPEFHRAAIHVQRWRLPPGADLFQTVYFPGMDTTMYRASVTASMLIMEFAAETEPTPEEQARAMEQVEAAFSLDAEVDLQPLDKVARQQFGKIAPLAEDDKRKEMLFRLSQERSIFSLGRFATWRNILLDDVVQDIDVIKRLLRTGGYDVWAAMS